MPTAAPDPAQPETTLVAATVAAASLLALDEADGAPPTTSGVQGNVAMAARLAQAGTTSP